MDTARKPGTSLTNQKVRRKRLGSMDQGGALKPVRGGEVLGERGEVGVVPGIADRRRLLGERLAAGCRLRAKRELIQELAHGAIEVPFLSRAVRHTGQRLRESAAFGRVLREPLRCCRDRLRHLRRS
jgi:hypothetical protein